MHTLFLYYNGHYNHNNSILHLKETFYFFFGKKRKRHRRAHQVSGPHSLQEQIIDPVDDQDDDPHEYTLVKERKQPRYVPKRTKRPKEQGVGHRVGCRTIIDIHLEVLDECQEGNTQLFQKDFFEILVQEFMGLEFMKEEKVPEEQVSMVEVTKEQVPSSDSGFREEDFVSEEEVTRVNVP
ncbi:SICA antigen [Plasmodium coatneyi]|uniref:SICA antigen n=1 Tax=Plasmodium coatneyi TaxID=208452 RepID=A0A1B1DTB7_9APIC|nr:SICA antigen [Plasmodium coatneyi]ANQ06031.1 SICA antigen [Plasmodium coatneyi]